MLAESYTAVIARGEDWVNGSTTEPYEASWAREAVIIVRTLETGTLKPGAKAHVQVSLDGMRWIDEGTSPAISARSTDQHGAAHPLRALSAPAGRNPRWGNRLYAGDAVAQGLRKMRANRLKEVWASGRQVNNGWLAIPSSHSAEVMSHIGFDSLTVDLQHGAVDYAGALVMLTAIATTQVVPLARPTALDPPQIMKLLDAGAYGIICPMIDSPRMRAASSRPLLSAHRPAQLRPNAADVAGPSLTPRTPIARSVRQVSR